MHNSLLSLWLTAKSYRFSVGAVFFSEADFCSGDEGQTRHRRWRIVDNCKRGEAERSLEKAAAGALSLGGSVVAGHHR